MKQTQGAKILNALKEAKGGWVNKQKLCQTL